LSIGLSLSNGRGASSEGENGETGLEVGLLLPLLCGNVSALSLSPLGDSPLMGSWLGETFGDGSGDLPYLGSKPTEDLLFGLDDDRR